MSALPPAASAAIVPFWNRLRAITLYPTKIGALVTIVLLALGNLAIYLPFGRLLSLLVTVAGYRYAFECLRATANGYLEPPEIAQSADPSLGWKQIWLMVILIIVAAVGLVLLGPSLGLIFVLFLGVSLPGATMTLAMDESLASALNPGKWLSIFARIGWPYLAVVGLCLIVSMSQGYAAALVARILPGFVAVIAVGFISSYALVVTFHLMGYLIYQYHDALGFVPDAPQLSRQLAKPDPDQEVLDEVSALIRNGKPEAATALLRGQLHSRGGTPAVHTQYRKLLRLANDNEELLRHGRDYLNILIAQDKGRLALDLMHDCQMLDPTFAPAEAGDVTHLAGMAAKLGQPQITLRLLSGFHKRFPKSKDIPQNYLLVATLLHERMNQDDQARTLLNYLKMTYPQHPLVPDIDAHLAMIERMAAATKKI